MHPVHLSSRDGRRLRHDTLPEWYTGPTNASRPVLVVVRSSLAGVLAFTCATFTAQPEDRAPDRLPVASQIELPRLIDLAAARLTVKIEYDPAVLKGSVALRGLDAMDGGQLWDLTNQLLAARGFTTVKPPGATAFSVVRLQDASAPTLAFDGVKPFTPIKKGSCQTRRGVT